MFMSNAAAGARSWTNLRDSKAARMADLGSLASGKLINQRDIVEALQTLIHSGDRVALEGDNQKQADFLSRSLVQVDPVKLHDIHLLISTSVAPNT
jgi:malonate decarboxylase alpha subunit